MPRSGHTPTPTPGGPLPYRTGVIALGRLVVTVAGLVLLVGWGMDVALVRSVIPGAVGMKALTAVGLLCAAVSLLLMVDPTAPARRRVAGMALSVVPGVLGVMVLGEDVFRRDLGIDELLFVDQDGRDNGISAPGGFAPTTGVCFILTTSALLLLDSGTRRGWLPAEVAAVPVAIVAGMAILGYAYSLPTFYGPASAAKMAVNTAVCFIALAGAIVLARPRGRLLRLATTTDPGGVMVRRLSPFVVVVPLVLGWLHLRSVESDLLEPEAAAWWLSAATGLGLVVVIGWCATMLSRTDVARRALEQELRRSYDNAVELTNIKSDFVASMSHEIRNPLSGVIGMTDLLLQTPLANEQREYAQAIRDSGDALMAVVGDVLDFSKIEAGKLEIEAVDFRLDHLVRSTSNLVMAQARAGGVKLSTWIDASLPETVTGDPVRIRQVLLNLMGNAVKFTHDGEVGVRVAAEPETCGGGGVRFEVSDAGIGISPDALEKLFESFTQADRSTTREYGGTGLGLAISKQLVELMDGSIGAESDVMRGSRFWFTLPLPGAATVEQAPPSSGEGPPAAEDFRAGFAATATVLIAEDNDINQIVVSRMLEKLGFAVEIAVNGREAVDRHATGSFDVILMDCQMPELDGYNATREIRLREAGACHIPIIAMTAHTMQGDRQRCLDAGMDDYLGKPLRSNALETILAQALAASRADEPRRAVTPELSR